MLVVGVWYDSLKLAYNIHFGFIVSLVCLCCHNFTPVRDCTHANKNTVKISIFLVNLLSNIASLLLSVCYFVLNLCVL